MSTLNERITLAADHQPGGSFWRGALHMTAVLAVHLALLAWLVQRGWVAPAVLDMLRMDVRTIEAPAALPQRQPAPETPRPKPQAAPVRAQAVPDKPTPEPMLAAADNAGPAPSMASVQAEPPAQPAAPAATAAPAAPAAPVVTQARFDADYLNNPAPVYPLTSRMMKEQGTVLLLVNVTAQGDAERVRVQQSSGKGRLDEAALEAVRHWRFVPAKRGDQAVAASVIVPIVFELDR